MCSHMTHMNGGMNTLLEIIHWSTVTVLHTHSLEYLRIEELGEIRNDSADNRWNEGALEAADQTPDD